MDLLNVLQAHATQQRLLLGVFITACAFLAGNAHELAAGVSASLQQALYSSTIHRAQAHAWLCASPTLRRSCTTSRCSASASAADGVLRLPAPAARPARSRAACTPEQGVLSGAANSELQWKQQQAMELRDHLEQMLR